MIHTTYQSFTESHVNRDYTKSMTKYVIVEGKTGEEIVSYYHDAKSIKFIGHNEGNVIAIISVEDYNESLADHEANSYSEPEYESEMDPVYAI
jgi:hypothetical protein